MYKYDEVKGIGSFLIADTSQGIDHLVEYIVANKVENIIINQHKGYELKDIKDLSSISNLKKMMIVSTDIDLAGIENLTNLTYIYFSSPVNSKVDFSRFQFLEYLNVEWNKKILNLNHLKGLSRLVLRKYKGDFLEFERVPISDLTLISSNIPNLEILEYFPRLKKISLFNLRKLECIAGLNLIKNGLIDIELESCKKIVSYDVFSELVNLKSMKFFGCPDFSNLDFVNGMNSLQFFSFVGIKVLNDDITPCLNINYVGFTDRKTYNCKNLDGKAILKNKP